jgi:hypothetical protein
MTAAAALSSTNTNGGTERGTRHHALQDEVSVPKSMAEALEWDDPVQALLLLSEVSHIEAVEQAAELQVSIQSFQLALPDLLLSFSKQQQQHPLDAAIACSDSIRQSLSKIASGGSQASQEIRQLEGEKRDLEEHAQAVEAALMLRRNSDQALQALQSQHWHVAAEAVRPWLDWKKDAETEESEVSKRCRAYAGEYCLKQLATAHSRLKESLLQQYEEAVQQGDLRQLGQLTPVLSLVQLEPDAVRLYLQFLKVVLQQEIQKQQQQPQEQQQKDVPPFVAIGRVYNAAVACLRHHLPMVSHCLYKADGDAAVVQLVHVQVEEAVLPLLEQYQVDRQLAAVSSRAHQIYAALEERYTGRQSTVDDGVDVSQNDEADDCGFSTFIGSLSDADSAMEEAARCIQHSESYIRFIQHTCSEVNKARRMRFERVQAQDRLERERQEWNKGKTASSVVDDEKEFEPLYILPDSTPLHLAIAEIGGQYASIERCLLLASMQRAFVSSPDTDPRYYRPISIPSMSRTTNKALQTSLVEACLYAARHGTQRACATGHTLTAGAVANFCSDCLTGVLLEVLSQRAEEAGVALLKPGEGLLVGSAGLFNNASNLIRQGAHSGVVGVRHAKDDFLRRQKVEQDLARACATLNDLEAAAHYSQQLEAVLSETVEKGFAPDKHETEQLRLCVKSLATVTESFRIASNSAVESLESVLKPRLRSIVGEAVGSEASSSTTFMGSSVIGGGKTADRVMARMNYNLDEEAFNLLQVSEGYVTRLCTLLDELLEPLRLYLVPRLWDTLLLSVLGTVSKRLETSLRKCQFTALGALTLDSDIRDILSYTKDRLYSPEYSSNNMAVTRACSPLSRLLQIAKLLSVDDLEDVLDLISSAKRKGNWDLKLEEAKALLSSRIEFESGKVNELLRLPDDD